MPPPSSERENRLAIVADRLARTLAGNGQDRQRRGVTANDILRAVNAVHEAGEEPSSELVAKVVLPVFSVAEREFGRALSHIGLDDMAAR
jgi:hypothetical protein